MGDNKKLGIQKEDRILADRYAKRFGLTDHSLVLSRDKNDSRKLYFFGFDEFGLEYRIAFNKVKRMRSPKGIQIVNKLDYLIHQSNLTHGKDVYDFSLVKEEDIAFHNKLSIICKTHGVFKKRKSAHITDAEGCPQCAMDRFKNVKKY